MSKLKAGRTFDCEYEGDVFKLRVMSGDDVDRYNELLSEYQLGKDAKERQRIIQELLSITVAAWPWEGSIRSVLNDGDLWQLIGASMRGAHLSPDERKKFVLQPKSATG